MVEYVVIADSVTTYAQGLEAALRDAGYHPQRPTDLLQWVKGASDDRAVLVTIRTIGDRDFLQRLRGAADYAVLVALLPDATADDHALAFRHGANATARWEADPAHIVHVLVDAANGQAVMPTRVAQQLAAHSPILAPEGWITDEETNLLRALARGATIKELADTTHRSERTMYRELVALYGKIAADNRTEAIIWATRRGLIPST